MKNLGPKQSLQRLQDILYTMKNNLGHKSQIKQKLEILLYISYAKNKVKCTAEKYMIQNIQLRQH